MIIELISNMNSNMKKQIYQAQCIGNVEPIEYMIPYPSMRSLIEGQNIKYSKQIIIEDLSITNFDFYNLVQKTATWLLSKGLKPKDRLIIKGEDPFFKTILLFGVWHLGASAILPGEVPTEVVKSKTTASNEISINKSQFEIITKLTNNFIPTYKPLLNEEALIIFEKGSGIILSHYNLLVNVNSIQKLLPYPSQSRISIKLPCDSISWVIFGSILPIYSSYIIDNSAPDFTIGLKNCNLNLRFDLKNLLTFSDTDIGICPENSGCISFGNSPIHLTNYIISEKKLEITGHSVMMGYLNEITNEKSFYNKTLNLDF